MVRLVILEARYGWAEDIWAPRVCSHAAGCKDVTPILQRDVKSSAGNFGKELHLNPDRRHQFMNNHLWPETAAGPPIPRKLAVRYRFENEHDPLDHGEIFELITAAVPNETVCVHITSLNSDPPSYPIAASGSGFEGLLGGGVQVGGLGPAPTNMNREGAGASTGSNIELLLSSHPGEAIVPKWRNTVNVWGQWDYIELGVGPIRQNNRIDSGCCPTTPLRVDYDGQFLALSKGSGAHIAHGEMVFDVAMWQYEENNLLVLVKVHPGHSDVTRKGGGGRDFVVHADGTISPTSALQFVLGKRPDNGALALVPRGSAHVCVLKAVNGSGRASATAPSLSVEGMRGKIDFLGLWKDNGEDRALPIKMNVNPNDPGQVARAFECLLKEMRHRGAREGLLAAQSYNQMHWTCNLRATEEENYEKHGFIGYVDKVCKSSWSGKVHSSEGITFPSFSGRMDVLGGDWQNAVYKVTIDEDDFAGQQHQPAIFTTETPAPEQYAMGQVSEYGHAGNEYKNSGAAEYGINEYDRSSSSSAPPAPPGQQGMVSSSSFRSAAVSGQFQHQLAPGETFPTQDLKGCWFLWGVPLFLACVSKDAVDDDPHRYVEDGCALLCMVLPIPAKETWTRIPGSNDFRKDNDWNAVAHFEKSDYAHEAGFIHKCKCC
mmetsp:Transcript_4325/g.10555  ORF Transcript_4325/g.10555 Transcript_4325/m.10555 type:complete len:658 (+) Transcript_4325:232-2205(+)|eukprot:g2424.t1